MLGTVEKSYFNKKQENAFGSLGLHGHVPWSVVLIPFSELMLQAPYAARGVGQRLRGLPKTASPPSLAAMTDGP